MFKKNAGKYVGNFNYRYHSDLTRRVDLLLAAGLGLNRQDVLEILSYIQRVLSINVYAGEKGIPESVKAKFPRLEINQKRQQQLFTQVDRILKDYYGFTDNELYSILNRNGK